MLGGQGIHTAGMWNYLAFSVIHLSCSHVVSDLRHSFNHCRRSSPFSPSPHSHCFRCRLFLIPVLMLCIIPSRFLSCVTRRTQPVASLQIAIVNASENQGIVCSVSPLSDLMNYSKGWPWTAYTAATTSARSCTIIKSVCKECRLCLRVETLTHRERSSKLQLIFKKRVFKNATTNTKISVNTTWTKTNVTEPAHTEVLKVIETKFSHDPVILVTYKYTYRCSLCIRHTVAITRHEDTEANTVIPPKVQTGV